jgi:signal transduction histidine kinase
LKVLRILAEAYRTPGPERSQMKSRNWSIRSKIIALITVPLVAFLALWIFATTLTAGPAFNLLHARTLVDQVGTPGIELVKQLQRERLFSVEYLSGAGPVTKELTDQRAATDRVAAQFRDKAGGEAVQNAANDSLRNRIAGIFTMLDSLTGNRGHIDRREIDAIGAQGFYNGVIDSAFKMFAACATFNDESIDRELRALTTVGNGEEYLGRVDSLVAGATVAGSLNADMRTEMLQDIGTGRYLLDQGIDDMTPTERNEWVELSAGAGNVKLNHMLDTLVADSKVDAPPPVASADYRPTYVAVGAQVREFEDRATDSLAKRATPLAISVLARLAVAAVLGLLALVISLIVSIRIGRSIVGRLGRLRAEAREMADERLPGVVRRLQRGEAVDVEVEAPPLEYGLDEIGQLGTAFNDVQRTAVESAVEEANVRRGINEVFLNIARRSQTLLHRQLALLDKMERRETEPQELEDLYRVDHLATRMRRHAEDLVILAGAAPGRGWRNPVPVIDVIRGAISEVEDYKRVDIRTVEQSAVLGRAVGDVIHLLAELLENAASFSPPHTRVQVGGTVLPGGYLIEIEDRGLGMATEALEEANRKLLEPPDFDPSDSARLGLFVVGQLSGRHGIRVSLRPSAYGGITATVLVPSGLVVVGPGTPAGPSGEQPLVGSGEEDPSRRSLASLQWSGAGGLREVTVSGRPVGAEAGWEPGQPSGAHRRPVLGLTGPSPSTVADELSADGLVQRRRNRRPTTPKPDPAARPASAPPATPLGPNGLATPGGPATPPGSEGPSGPDGLATPPGPSGLATSPGPSDLATPSGPNGLTTPTGPAAVPGPAERPSVPRQRSAPGQENLAGPAARPTSPPAGIGASGGFDLPALDAPTVSLPSVDLPGRRRTTRSSSNGNGTRPAPNSNGLSSNGLSSNGLGSKGSGPADEGPTIEGPTTEDGLPKRVRQANLVPQLRDRPPALPPDDDPTVQLRTPEQIRAIMSALQQGTTRGRRDAARIESEPPPADPISREDSSPTEPSDPEEKGNQAPPVSDSFANAATVSFPVLANLAPIEGGDGEAPEQDADNEVTRPEKDA